MTEKIKNNQRSRLGYGSSYSRGNRNDMGQDNAIRTVLGGQVWMVKPDKQTQNINPCVWMQAGVAKFKSCNNFYDCTTCKYDFGMQSKVQKGKQSSWQDAMRKRSSLDRICRHSLTNRIAKRACAYDYNCNSCDFDQFFEDVLSPKTKNTPIEIQMVKGFNVPMEYHFHNGHTWARIESGGYIRIGMDDFALKLFGQADSFELPLMGKELDQGNAGWGMNRKGNSADVLSPVGGIIMEVNSKIRENPGAANDDPYSDGWLFLVRHPDVKKTIKNLMTETTSMEWINNETTRLESMIEDVAGPLAADGGYLANDIYGNLPKLDWTQLTKTFLKTG